MIEILRKESPNKIKTVLIIQEIRKLITFKYPKIYKYLCGLWQWEKIYIRHEWITTDSDPTVLES